MKLFFYGFIWLFIIVISLITFSYLFIKVSKLIENIILLTFISFIGQGLVLVILGMIMSNWLSIGSTKIVYIISTGIIITTIVLLQLSLFKSLPGPIMEKVLPEGTQYMSLESGSEVAYWHFPAKNKVNDVPILFIHGGPGAHVREIDREFFKSFADEGYDVYMYDQPGGGFSEIIPLSETTMARWIEDIDSIRKNIGAEKIVLVGQSFGGNICSTYASEYPEYVESIIFTAPGELRPKSLSELNKEKNALESSDISFATENIEKFEPTIIEAVRFATGIMMCKYGGLQAAENLISQKEITEYSTRTIPEAIHMAYHLKYVDRVPVIKSGGINVLVNATLHSSYKGISLSVIENLKAVEVPVLILRTQYDYVEWQATKFYDEVYPNSYLVYISESGHIPWSVNLDDTYNKMLYFLKEDYDKLDIYTGINDPRLND